MPSRSARAALLSAQSKIALLGLALVAWAAPVRALEPLDEFLRSADTASFDAREASAVRGQREADARRAKAELLPTLQVTGRYTRNQYKGGTKVPINGPNGMPTGEMRNIVITPYNQLEATITATMPIINVPSWRQIGAAKDNVDAAGAQLAAARVNVRRSTAQQYYAVIAAEALARSAQRTLDAAQKNLEWIRARRAAGVASELDERRAEAEVERNRQILADTQYQIAVARRGLETLSGKTPAAGAPVLTTDLAPEAPLEVWLGKSVSDLPQVRADVESAHAASKLERAARAALLPTIDATATERSTNAPGFLPKNYYYAVGLVATLNLDATSLPALRAQQQAAQVARIRAERSQRDALDAIHDAWYDVLRQIEKSRASRAQLSAAQFAVRIARERYQAGTATFLDVVLAERDELSADASRIQADADLCSARAQLRLLADEPLDPALCAEAP